jgi:hypothetical protein
MDHKPQPTLPPINLLDPNTPDTTIVKVPVSELRAALWYYNNYWNEKERADSLDKLHTAELQYIGVLQASIATANMERDQALKDLEGWKTATFITGGVASGITIIEAIRWFTGNF